MIDFLFSCRLKALVEMAPTDKKTRIFMIGDFLKGRDKIITDPFEVCQIQIRKMDA